LRTRRTTTSPDRTRRPTTSTLATLLVAGLSAAGLAAPAPTSAQVLEGYLLEGGSGEPIEGGTVGLFTPRGFTIDIGVSDDDGFFSLQAPDAGTYFMTADATGFVDLTHGEFDLYAGEALSFDVFLRPRPVEIEGVEAEVERLPLAMRVQEMRLGMVGFRARANSGMGHYITPERLRARNAAQASDILRAVPRMQIQQGFGNEVRMDCGLFSAFIDGVQIWSGQAWEMDAFVYINDVSAMEIYTSLAQLPVEFRKGGNCGAVVVWTKG